MILSGYDGTVAERPADIGNDTRSKGKKRRPGWCGDLGDQNVTMSHLVKLVWAGNYSRCAGDTPWAGADALDHIARLRPNTSRGKSTEVNAQEAVTAFERQGSRRRDLAFACTSSNVSQKISSAVAML